MALTTVEEAQLRQLIAQQAAILSLASSESTIISKLGASKLTIAQLPAAGSISDTDLFLVRQGTQEKNVTGAIVKALASSTVSAATTSAAGVVELATNAETQTGTDPDRAVTPAGMASVTATESRRGLVQLASEAEVATGTELYKAVTPAGLASVINARETVKAWGNFDGTASGTIAARDSYNVASIVKNALGEYTVTLTDAMPNAYFVVVASAAYGTNALIAVGYPLSASTFKLFATGGANTRGDSANMQFAIFGADA